MRPIANAGESTADVYLGGRGLPDLRRWPEQFAQWANRSYDFRGVEVTLSGTVREQDGSVVLISSSIHEPVRLAPLQAGMKVQWDHQARVPQEATVEEMNAYDDLVQSCGGWRRRGGSGHRPADQVGLWLGYECADFPACGGGPKRRLIERSFGQGLCAPA